MPNSPMSGLKGHPQHLGCLLLLLTILPSKTISAMLNSFLGSTSVHSSVKLPARHCMDCCPLVDDELWWRRGPAPWSTESEAIERLSLDACSRADLLHGSMVNPLWFWNLELLWKIKHYNYISKKLCPNMFFSDSLCSDVDQRCKSFRNIDLDIHPDMRMNHFTLVPM